MLTDNKAVSSLIELIIRIFIAILIYYIGKKLVKVVLRIFDRFLERAGTDISLRKFLYSGLRIILYIVVFILMIRTVGIGTSSIIAVLGSAGLTLGLALQGSLSNLAGGVLILLLKPFRVGDYIIEDTKGNEGTVQSIDVFYTRLLTIDNRMVAVPNGTLANSSLTNVTSQTRRRIDMIIPIAYNADLRLAKEKIKEVVDRTEDVMKDQPIDIFVSELGESSVNLGLRAWFPTDSYWKAKWKITEEIKLEFDRCGIEIPYNKLDVNILNTPSDN
ncbi:MAG: mechanosensitive ion channel [Lachnospiraceae bacterium]|nr:mechanosensitive ion channel [Lachnospiraceae bacterium]